MGSSDLTAFATQIVKNNVYVALVKNSNGEYCNVRADDQSFFIEQGYKNLFVFDPDEWTGSEQDNIDNLISAIEIEEEQIADRKAAREQA